MSSSIGICSIHRRRIRDAARSAATDFKANANMAGVRALIQETCHGADLPLGCARCAPGAGSFSPAIIATMLEFVARCKVAPQVEYFPMSKVNEALTRLAAGKAVTGSC